MAISSSGDELYVGSHDAQIFSINSSDGSQLWISTTSGAVRSLALDANGMTLYAGLDDGLYKFNVRHRPWDFTANDVVKAVATSPSGDTVFAGSYDNHVYALRASDGKQIWNFPAGSAVFAVAVSPSGDTVYAGSQGSNVYALQSSDGGQLWNFTTNGQVVAVAVSPSGDTVYAGSAGSEDSHMYALRASNGAQLWTLDAVGGVWALASSPSGNTVYAGWNDGHVYALRASDRRQMWSFTTGAAVSSMAVSPSGDTVYAGAEDKHVYALRTWHGRQMWNFTTGGAVMDVAVSPSGDTVYAVSSEYNNNNHVYALRASDGMQLWNHTAHDMVWAVAVSPSGDMVYGLNGGHVYALSPQFPFEPLPLFGVGSWIAIGAPRSGDVFIGVDGGTVLKLNDDYPAWSFSVGTRVNDVVLSLQTNNVYAATDRGFFRYKVSWLTGRQLWNFTTGGGLRSVAVSPSDRMVYAGSADRNVYALRTSDGMQLWNFTAGGGVVGVAVSPSENTVYAGSVDHHVYALRTLDGRQIWNFTAGGWLWAVAVSPSGDTVYAGADRLYVLKASDGRQLWNVSVGHDVYAVAVSPSGNTVYAGSDHLYSSDGWDFTAGNWVVAVALNPSGDTVYAGSLDQHVYALRASDGRQMWKLDVGDAVAAVAVSPSGDTVYAGSHDNHTYALRASDGMQLWNYTAGAMVWAVAVSPSGDTVYAGSEDNHTYALSEHLLLTKSPATCSALTGSGDVAFAGCMDHHVFAFNASSENQLWNFTAQGGVVALALSPTDETVYAASYDHCIYALNASTGQEQWRVTTTSVATSIAVSPSGDLIYAAADDLKIYALSTTNVTEVWEVDWDTIYMWIGLASGGLITLLWWSSRWIIRKGHTVRFFITGAVFGWCLGVVTGYVMVSLPTEVQEQVLEDHQTSRWLLQDPGCYGISILVSALLMAGIWALSAFYDRLLVLTDVCSAVVLLSSLLVSFNLVPGLWLALLKKPSPYLGSHSSLFVGWWISSYPVGLVAMTLALALLNVLYKDLEKGKRTWRGHVYTKWSTLLPAFHWGFFSFWFSTASTLFLFNRHGMFVPPYTPLDVLGVAVSLIAFGFQLMSRRDPTRDFHGWTRARALDLASFVTWWPQAKDSTLLREWEERTDDVYQRLSLKKITHLALNAWCPTWQGLRGRVSAWTGLHLTSRPGCQPSMKDELTWSLLRFKVASLVAVMPLLLLWFYARFQTTARDYLSLQSVYAVSTTGLNGHFEPVKNLPLPVVGTITPSYIPMVFKDEPFPRCEWRDTYRAIDPGDFNLCMKEATETCMLYGYECPRCEGLANTILGEPSVPLWSNMKLIVYAGFFLVCLWAIYKETDEKVHVLTALRRNHLFREGQTWRDWHWWERHVLVPGFLLLLGVLYAACLCQAEADQEYYVVSNPRVLQEWSRYYMRISMYGAARGLWAYAHARGARLIWYCDVGDFGGGPAAILKVTYSAGKDEDVAIGVAAGLYFFYQCFSLVSRQRRLYDFVDGDVLLDAESLLPREDCSYWSIFEVRDRGDSMTRADVVEHLHHNVYLPFIKKVYDCRPDLLQGLFNEDVVNHLWHAVNLGQTGESKHQERE